MPTLLIFDVVLAALLILCIPQVQAETLAAKLAYSDETPCLNSVTPLFMTEIIDRGVNSMLNGMKRGASLPDDWGAGNFHYDQAYVIVRNAIDKDQAENGRWLDISAQDILEMKFRRASGEDQRFLADFLPTRPGKVYWHYMLDSAKCSGYFIGLDKRKVRLSSEERAVSLKWQSVLKSRPKEFEEAFIQLSAEERMNFQKAILIEKYISKTEAPDEKAFQLHWISEDNLQAKILNAVSSVSDRIDALIKDFVSQHSLPRKRSDV